MADPKYRWLYMTASNREEAIKIGRALVEARLVACVNVFDGMTSLYWWQERVQEESESALVAKTRADQVPAVVQRVRQLHSYECPCVVALPIVDGNAPFLDWLDSQVSHSDQ